ncbi:cytochrome P450 [Mycena pura]|uniref:Cytochrome P450 n=1 Tax=Mycena pura TaxID=153505 RepID=A0AAD6V2G9_9AGAR|nr:cytochrome P450 [Mycena pura]
MLNVWKSSSSSDEAVLSQLEDAALRLGLNVITGAAYGIPLGWDENPPTAVKSSMSYRRSLEQLSAHLMPLFLTPRWALRLAPRSTNWGQAWEAYTAFGGYMLGMLHLARQRRGKNEEGDNFMTVLTRAEENQELDPTEVLGNAFIFLFAGHETTANTLHYALLLLALHPEVQSLLQAEIDELYGTRKSLDYDDFPRVRWVTAVMNETLRCFAPTAMVNKWTDAPTPIPYGKGTVVLPPQTRVSTNITGIHANPAVWGPDAKEWRPARWIAPAGGSDYFRSPPPSPGYLQEGFALGSLPPTPMTTPSFSRSPSPGAGGVRLIKPAKGAFLPFSDGSRMCSGRKFAAVEFCAVLCTILKEHRLEIPRGWSEERMWAVLRGRKPGALTLQPPEAVPIVLVSRRR